MAMSNFSTVPSFGQPAEAWLSRGGIAINGVHYGRPDDAIEWGVRVVHYCPEQYGNNTVTSRYRTNYPEPSVLH